MSHDPRKNLYDRDRDRDRHGDRRAWVRPDNYRESRDPRLDRDRDRGDRSRKRSRSINRSDIEKRRQSPRKNDKDMIDDNILSEISKLPEPSELWENQNAQFHEGGYPNQPQAPPPPSFQTEPSNSSYAGNYQPSYSGIYDDFPSNLSGHPSLMPDVSSWNQMSLPPPPGPHTTYQNAEDQMKKEASLETERHLQKSALSKQREDYIKKASILKKEMETLKDQRNELRGDPKRSPSPDTKRFLKENTKLQLEIQNKLKTITNVVDMLNGIIGEEAAELAESDDSPDRKRKSRSPSSSKKFNYVYYDPEMHWCRVCNEFPSTAKDYLNHLHSIPHHKMAAAHMEAPWHTVTGMNEGYPSYASAPTKRTPIRGLQFFVPSTAWYCKLCDQFIGDLHCASAHLKSITHSKNYINFVEQNPHWETDWMSDRQKAFEKARATLKNKPPEVKPQYTPQTITFSKDGFHTKRKTSPAPPVNEKKKKKNIKDKKKKKKQNSSSSSSSSESSSDSDSAKKSKKSKKLKKIDIMDDKALEEWMTTIKTDKLAESDRKLLDNLKSRIKKDRDEKRRTEAHDTQRVAELQRKIRESEARNVASKRADSRWRDERERRDERRDERRSEQRREERRSERRDKSPEKETKKPEIKKMPFIGKMPVYKQLNKVKADEVKKEEEDKKKEEESAEKKKAELDAEIQKKVADFKEKIAKAQQEREQQLEQLKVALQPPALLVAPPAPVVPPPPAPAPQLPPPPPGAPALPKDFQEALDIIFPDAKAAEKAHQELISAMQPGILGCPPFMPPFNPALGPLGLMQPPGMLPFDLNPGLFPQPQLYDQHVPINMPNNQLNFQHKPKPRNNNPKPQYNNRNNHKQANKPNVKGNRPQVQKQVSRPSAAAAAAANGQAAKMKEELDDLAMLGIDASDVGSGM